MPRQKCLFCEYIVEVRDLKGTPASVLWECERCGQEFIMDKDPPSPEGAAYNFQEMQERCRRCRCGGKFVLGGISGSGEQMFLMCDKCATGLVLIALYHRCRMEQRPD